MFRGCFNGRPSGKFPVAPLDRSAPFLPAGGPEGPRQADPRFVIGLPCFVRLWVLEFFLTPR
jgi:hypothetical protein